MSEGGEEMASLPVPDEILAEIFLRMHAPADLVRASAACVSFRRVVTDRSFLRRFRKLHTPPILGFLEGCKVFHPAIAPHRSASAARAVALVGDFSFSFLPAPASDWLVRDIRDGRVLLDRDPQSNIDSLVIRELVVCDPLHRRYLLLPPIPDNLAASVDHYSCETFLGSHGHKEVSAADETLFSVVWMAQCSTKLVALVFSSRNGQWRAVSSQSWSSLLPDSLSSTRLPLLCWRQCAYGCFYWVTDCKEKLLVLDTCRMEFSIADPLPEAIGLRGVDIAIVEAGEGRPGMFVRPEYINCLKYSIRLNNCGSSSQWQFERTVPLDFEYLVMGSAGRHLFIFQWQNNTCFLLDVKKFLLKRVFVSDFCLPYGHMYSNFPPSLLSTPTISSGVEKGTEKELLEQSCAAGSSAQSPPWS